MNKIMNTTYVEDAFPSVAIVLVMVLSVWGAVAMLGGSILGLVAFPFIYRERLRTRGWLTVTVAVAVSAALAYAVVIIAVSLI